MNQKEIREMFSQVKIDNKQVIPLFSPKQIQAYKDKVFRKEDNNIEYIEGTNITKFLIRNYKALRMNESEIYLRLKKEGFDIEEINRALKYFKKLYFRRGKVYEKNHS